MCRSALPTSRHRSQLDPTVQHQTDQILKSSIARECERLGRTVLGGLSRDLTAPTRRELYFTGRVVHKNVLSISNGHARIVDMSRSTASPEERNFLISLRERLKELPFVRSVKYVKHEFPWESRRVDALLRIETDARSFDYFTELKRSFLGASVTHAAVSYAKELAKHGIKLLLFAPYIPGPTAELLIKGGVDFVDLEGNTHISLEPHYHWTSIGHRKQANFDQQRLMTAATLQVLFATTAHPESAAWTVRELAAAAGVSKSKAANARRELIRNGTLQEVKGRFRPTDQQDLTDQLLQGYRQVLRPRLLIGRFRPPEKSIESFVSRLQDAAAADGFRYALTGGPAAHRLQKFYFGPEAPVFIEPTVVGRLPPRSLRLLPDREGPVVLLKAFGDLVYWRTTDGASLTNPWLIYAELMNGPDPRAHEAARHLREEFLNP